MSTEVSSESNVDSSFCWLTYSSFGDSAEAGAESPCAGYLKHRKLDMARTSEPASVRGYRHGHRHLSHNTACLSDKSSESFGDWTFDPQSVLVLVPDIVHTRCAYIANHEDTRRAACARAMRSPYCAPSQCSKALPGKIGAVIEVFQFSLKRDLSPSWMSRMVEDERNLGRSNFCLHSTQVL